MDKESEPTLNFKPLSEGLGFHPFENGLPYSPAAKPSVSSTTGTGAVAAGRPAFVFPQQPIAKVAAPTAVAVAPAQIIAKTLPAVSELGWDYLMKRMLAFWVDSIINMTLGFITLAVSLWREDLSANFYLGSSVFFITLGFLLFFNWALTTAQEVAFGTSIGKRLFGLSLDGSAIATFVRALFFIPSLLFFGLGAAWAGIDSGRRGFHDLVSGIQPEEV